MNRIESLNIVLLRMLLDGKTFSLQWTVSNLQAGIRKAKSRTLDDDRPAT